MAYGRSILAGLQICGYGDVRERPWQLQCGTPPSASHRFYFPSHTTPFFFTAVAYLRPSVSLFHTVSPSIAPPLLLAREAEESISPPSLLLPSNVNKHTSQCKLPVRAEVDRSDHGLINAS
jgi:hypothetical protein